MPENSATAFSCGRDGQFAMWKISETEITLIRKIGTKMEWPIELSQFGYLLGFQSSFFHVVNGTDDIVFSSNCGGGHRSSQFWISPEADGSDNQKREGNLVYVKKGSVIHETGELKSYQGTILFFRDFYIKLIFNNMNL